MKFKYLTAHRISKVSLLKFQFFEELKKKKCQKSEHKLTSEFQLWQNQVFENSFLKIVANFRPVLVFHSQFQIVSLSFRLKLSATLIYQTYQIKNRLQPPILYRTTKQTHGPVQMKVAGRQPQLFIRICKITYLPTHIFFQFMKNRRFLFFVLAKDDLKVQLFSSKTSASFHVMKNRSVLSLRWTVKKFNFYRTQAFSIAYIFASELLYFLVITSFSFENVYFLLFVLWFSLKHH